MENFVFSPKKRENHTLKIYLSPDVTHKFEVHTPPNFVKEKQMYFAEVKTPNGIRKCCMVGVKWFMI